MLCYRDTTFCCSPNCTGKCGRQLTDEVRAAAAKLKLPVSTAYYCGQPFDPILEAQRPAARADEKEKS